MLYLITDPGEKYIPTGKYVSFNPKDIPNTKKKSNTLRVALTGKSIVSDRKQVIIYNVDKLNARQSTLLVGMLYDRSTSVNVAMTCINDKKVSKHIRSLLGLRLKRIRAPGVKQEPNFFEKLSSYIQTKKVPEKELLLPLIKSMGNNYKLNNNNLDLICRIDELLFETDSEFLAYAWAGQHSKQMIRPVFKSVYKEEIKKIKIDPVIKKTRKAKKISTIKKRKKVGISNRF